MEPLCGGHGVDAESEVLVPGHLSGAEDREVPQPISDLQTIWTRNTKSQHNLLHKLHSSTVIQLAVSPSSAREPNGNEWEKNGFQQVRHGIDEYPKP